MTTRSQPRGEPCATDLIDKRGLSVVAVAVLLIGCMADIQVAVEESDCDIMMEEAIEEALKQFDAKWSARARRNLEQSRLGWTDDPNHSHVRERIRRAGVPRSLVRLELAGWSIPGYASSWFVEIGDEVVEYSTGPQSDGVVREMRVPREEWLAYVRYLQTLDESDIESVVSPSVVDAPVYFVCIQTERRSGALVIQAMPQRLPQFSLVAKTFGLSRTKDVPPEIANCLEDSRDCPTDLGPPRE